MTYQEDRARWFPEGQGPIPEAIQTKLLRLDKMQRGTVCRISEAALERTRLSIHREQEFGDTVVRTLWDLYSESLEVKEVYVMQGCIHVTYDRNCLFDVHDSWWGMFREKYMRWSLKKWPAKKRQVSQNYHDVRKIADERKLKIKVKAVYPHLPMAFPDCGRYEVGMVATNRYGRTTYGTAEEPGTAVVSIQEAS